MRYEGQIYRPPSEANSYILQATVGCSWNHCTYCDMYRDKSFRVRELAETLADIEAASKAFGSKVEKVFVADGDALVMEMPDWERILTKCKTHFPKLRQVSAYATAIAINDKRPEELKTLREFGLSLLYVGPETGDDVTFKRIAKGAGFSDHVQAAERARDAGIALSTIFLLGAGGTERSQVHAEESARLITEMDPAFVSMLTLTVLPSTPIAKLQARGKFTLPTVEQMLAELRLMIAQSNPTDAIFRTNHASNYLPLAGRLPRDRERIVSVLDRALAGQIPLRPESSRAL